MSEFNNKTNIDQSHVGSYEMPGLGIELGTVQPVVAASEVPEVRAIESQNAFEASSVWVDRLEADRARFGQFTVQVYNTAQPNRVGDKE